MAETTPRAQAASIPDGGRDDGAWEGTGKAEVHQDLSFLEKGGFEIIRIREKHGQFRKAVPTMPLPLAVLCCLLNIVLPGTGTFVSAFTVFKYPTEYEQKSEAFVNNLIAALLQILTLIILVGYIWSILWGITFVSLAIGKKQADEKEAGLPEPTKV